MSIDGPNPEELAAEIWENIWKFLPKTRQQFRDFASTCKTFYFFAKDSDALKKASQADYSKIETHLTFPLQKAFAVSKTLLALHDNGEIIIRKISDGSRVTTIPYPELKHAYWSEMLFSANEKYLITSDNKGVIKIFDVDSGEIARQHQITYFNGFDLYFSPRIKFYTHGADNFLAAYKDSNYASAIVENPYIYLYSAKTTEPKALLQIPGEQFIDMAVSEKHNMLVLLYAIKLTEYQYQTRFALYDLKTLTQTWDTELRFLRTQQESNLYSVKILPDSRVLFGADASSFYLFDRENNELLLYRTAGYGNNLYDFPITETGKYIALGFGKGVCMWDIDNQKNLGSVTDKCPEKMMLCNHDSSLIISTENEVTIYHFAKTIPKKTLEITSPKLR